MEGQSILGYVVEPSKVIKPPSGQIRIFKNSLDGRYYAKTSSGSIELIGGDNSWKVKGDIDCSANPNYPAAEKGDAYRVIAAGKIGGAAGVEVEIDDIIVAWQANIGGTQAAVGAFWSVEQANLVKAVLADFPLNNTKYTTPKAVDDYIQSIKATILDFPLNNNKWTTPKVVADYISLYISQVQSISNIVNLFEDWISSSPSGLLGWTSFSAGAGSTVSISNTLVTNNHFGILRLNVQQVGGLAGVNLGNDQILAGGGAGFHEGLFYINILATAAQDYIFRTGLGDSSTTADYVDGIYFEYNRSVSANWLICTANNSVRTKIDSGVAVVAGSWIKLKSEINSAGNLISYYITSPSPGAPVLVGTINTNIPTGAGRLCGPNINYQKTVGNGNRDIFVDYVQGQIIFNTPR